VLETMRECLQDVFDVPGLVGIMSDLRSRTVRLVESETPQPSPFARSLLFGYVGMFLYEGDAPLAERRAQALSLDSAMLAELLGATQLRELLDPAAIAGGARGGTGGGRGARPGRERGGRARDRAPDQRTPGARRRRGARPVARGR